MRSPHTAAKSSPRSPQWEKAHTQQWRPNAAKNKISKFIFKKKKSEILSHGWAQILSPLFTEVDKHCCLIDGFYLWLEWLNFQRTLRCILTLCISDQQWASLCVLSQNLKIPGQFLWAESWSQDSVASIMRNIILRVIPTGLSSEK